MRKHLGKLVRLAVFAGCVTYAFWGMDLASLLDSMRGYAGGPLLLSLLLSLLAYLALGVRLHFLMAERPGVRVATAASLVALGVNNLVPAKLGEVAKVLYLHRHVGGSMTRLLGLVFWERFADLNAVLLLGVVTLALLGMEMALTLPLLLVVGVWCALAVLRGLPGVVKSVVAVLPGQPLRALVAQLAESIRGGLGATGAVRGLGAGTLALWFFYAASTVVVLLHVAELDIGLAAALAVFSVAALGMAVPAAPGGLGVFEAAMVASLGWFDVPRNDALAAALVAHMLQFVPTTLAGVAILGREGLSMDAVRQAVERRRNAREP